ncbi:COBW domain-containing protein 1 [Podila verticillata]|nr:COBW domain-containing protein 1 [Podila verticillata]
MSALSDDDCPPLAVPLQGTQLVTSADNSDNEEDMPELIDTLLIGPSDGVSAKGASREEETPSKKIPITIITGFLGSGKSTLLDYILTEKHDFKVAVILNEFGDTGGIDQAMNVGMGGEVVEEWLELKNGCLCCTVKDNGVVAIENLMKKKGKFDYILLETTGLADPGPIASIFWMDDDIGSDIYLDGIVTLIDSKNVRKELDVKKEDGSLNETAKQIAMADRLILNKTDLVTKEEIDQLEADCRAMNGVAEMVRTQHSRVDLRFVLDIAAFDAVRAKELEQSDAIQRSTANVESEVGHDHVHDEGCGHNHEEQRPSGHLDQSIKTVTINFNTPTIDQNLFEHWLQTLLWEHYIPDLSLGDESAAESSRLDILRVKGIIKPSRSSTPNAKVVIQGVQELYDIKDAVAQPGQEELLNAGRVVFIGRGLDNKTRMLESCRQYLELSENDVTIQ